MRKGEVAADWTIGQVSSEDLTATISVNSVPRAVQPAWDPDGLNLRIEAKARKPKSRADRALQSLKETDRLIKSFVKDNPAPATKSAARKAARTGQRW